MNKNATLEQAIVLLLVSGRDLYVSLVSQQNKRAIKILRRQARRKRKGQGKEAGERLLSVGVLVFRRTVMVAT